MVRVGDKLKKAQEEGRTLFSFEYFPPKTAEGVANLYARLDRMCATEPAWVDVTWGAGGSTSKLTLDICKHAQNVTPIETMMHLTCTNLPIDAVRTALAEAKAAGLQNILALRGDPPVGEEWKQCEGGLKYAVDLVRLIRKEHGDHFGICVAGYPEAHLEAESYEKDLQYLKEKVDAGADLIVTQLFYDIDNYKKWVNDCRAIGITVPIVPGIMPIQTYAGFRRMTTLCKTKIPQHINDRLEPIKDDDEAVKAYGVELAVSMCQQLMEFGVPGLHFYSLNLEKSVLQILDGLGLSHHPHLRKELPWRPSPATHRAKEDVRPIFWNNRPKSYLDRTAEWDDFPNGRWGDSESPAFGDLKDYHLMTPHDAHHDNKKIWSASNALEAGQVFARFLRREIPRLPWTDGLAPETTSITAQLIRLNENGFLTINSQPRVNAAPSDHPSFGWGGRGGYVFQKAYLEFFCSPEALGKLSDQLGHHPSISYMASNHDGSIQQGNAKGRTNALTWGVFPDREIVQPTVACAASFQVWRAEAFALLDRLWVHTYEEGSPQRKFLAQMHASWLLVCVIENDFVGGDVFAPFETVIAASGR